MCVYTLQYSFIENGNPDCEQRKHFDSYIKAFWEKGCQITTNITSYDILIDEKADNLFQFSSNFFMQSIYNSFAISTIQLASFFSDSDTASIPKFLNYCEQNQNHIFTKDFYEERINIPNSRIKVDMGDFSVKLAEARQLLFDNQVFIKSLKDNRDKVFAHFEKDFLVTQKRQLSINTEDLKKGLSLAETIINKIGCYYDRSIRSFLPVNVADIKQTIYITDFYIKNRKQIQSLKRNGTLK